eukprot:Phypoly_transcript_04733.p1 GENE.Phypoly_transcript_04733~~Phypoly_transcript_04733.p1  ORF type:complete len:651 (+),score=123.30 Phypoly_transcript_04733:148-2100(+)
MEAIATLTALNGPYFLIPEQSLLLHYISLNRAPHLKFYPLANCSIAYQDDNRKVMVVCSGNSFGIEFFDDQEYRDFKGWLNRSSNRSAPPHPQLQLTLSQSTPSAPLNLPSSPATAPPLCPLPPPSSPSPSPSLASAERRIVELETTVAELTSLVDYYESIQRSLPSVSPITSSIPLATTPPLPSASASAEQKKIVDLEMKVAELTSLVEYHQREASREREQQENLRNKLHLAEREVENLTSTLMDALTQPPPPPPSSSQACQARVNSLVQATNSLVEKHAALKMQRESLLQLFNNFASSVDEQINKSKVEYETIVSELSQVSGPSATGSEPFANILEEARQKYDHQSNSKEAMHIDLAKAYYTVFYDLACKEVAISGKATVSPAVLDEARTRLAELNRSQDEERINFLHQIQDVHHAKEVILIAEQKIRRDAEVMQTTLRNMELRKAFERLLFHIERTRSGTAPIRCFISYAWPVTLEERTKLQTKLRQIRDDLGMAGIDAQLDLANMQGNIMQFMENGIQAAHKYILICTPRLKERAAEASNNLVTELGFAINRMTTVPGFIIPLLVEGTGETSIPKVIGNQSNTVIADLLYLDVTGDYEDKMVQMEPLGLIPMILGLGDNNNSYRFAYSAAFDRYTLQKQQFNTPNK